MVLGRPRKENKNVISYKYLFHRVESLAKPVKQSIPFTERFSNDFQKTKTKAIIPTNHNRNKQHD